MSDITRADEERMIFAILLECLCQQVEMLEGQEKQRAKQWVSELLRISRKTSKELRATMNPGTVDLFENMYDFFYMTLRDAAQVDAQDVDEFRKLVSDFIKEKQSKSIFQVNQNQ